VSAWSLGWTAASVARAGSDVRLVLMAPPTGHFPRAGDEVVVAGTFGEPQFAARHVLRVLPSHDGLLVQVAGPDGKALDRAVPPRRIAGVVRLDVPYVGGLLRRTAPWIFFALPAIPFVIGIAQVLTARSRAAGPAVRTEESQRGEARHTVLVSVTCLVAAVLVGAAAAGVRPQVVRTGSMTPHLPVGTIVLLSHTSGRVAAPGDVVAFRDPLGSGKTLLHRVVDRRTGEHGVELVTEGDAGSLPDPLPVSQADVVGRPLVALPRLAVAGRAIMDDRGVLLLSSVPLALWVVLASQSRRRHRWKPKHAAPRQSHLLARLVRPRVVPRHARA
jgi:signal peptidase I